MSMLFKCLLSLFDYSAIYYCFTIARKIQLKITVLISMQKRRLTLISWGQAKFVA